MKTIAAALVSCLAASASASPVQHPMPDAYGKYTIEAQGIKAQFIPYGASLTNLFVKDKNGVDRDIVLGHDNASYYPIDPAHPVYNAVPGRYANRIGNAKYTLDGKTYELDKNDGNNTLHSGLNNWSFRNFKIKEATKNSITFAIYDKAYSSKGMPGDVYSEIKYWLEPNKWKIRMTATPKNHKTPIMLTQHTYFNLDAFANPDTDLIWNHTLHTPFSKRLLEPDPNMLPTGKITNIKDGSTNDLHSNPPHQLGKYSTNPDWVGNCGTGSGCSGYNNLWLVDGASPRDVVARLSSAWSGITADLRTDQKGIQVYTCHWMDGSIPLKKTQGVEGRKATVNSGGCVAIEAQDWNDGINHPEWKRLDRQIFAPGQTYTWEAEWSFGVL